MADQPESVLKRCEEGHVFDVAKESVCPICGSPPAGGGAPPIGKEASETPEPSAPSVEPPPAHTVKEPGVLSRFLTNFPQSIGGVRGLAIGGAVVIALLIVAVIVGGNDAPTDRSDIQTAGPSETGPSAPAVLPREEERPPKKSSFSPSTAEPYGTWELFVPMPGSAPMRHVFEIRSDGGYSIYAGPYSHSGRVTFTGRVYQLQSRTSGYQDAGAFSTPDPDTIVFNGRLGRSVWARVRQQSLFDLTDDPLRLPKNVPAALRRMTKHIRDIWREDAEPVALEIKRDRAHNYELKVSFLSPRDKAGLVVTWGRYHSKEFSMGSVGWFDKPLPKNFIDLAKAYASFKSKVPIRKASLGYYTRGRGKGNTYDRAAPPGWLIIPEGARGGLVDAATTRR